MPRFDKSGPNGQGAFTGRGLGNCSTNQKNSESFRRGLGRGMGRMNRRFGVSNFTPSLEEEKQQLENRLNEVNAQLEK